MTDESIRAAALREARRDSLENIVSAEQSISSNLRQLARLLEINPPLDKKEIAHRMALKPYELRRLLQLAGVKR